MKISTQTRYALRFLLELSLAEKNARVTTHAIAKSQSLSEKYLEAIATKLRKAGIIASIKGAGGGYVLARDPSSVTAGDVTRLMETTFFDISCTEKPCEECAQFQMCAMRNVLMDMSEQFTIMLDDLTIEKMRDFYRREIYSTAMSG